MGSRARRLAAQLRDLRDAAAAFPDALVLLDDAGRVRWINRAADRLLGLHWPHDRGVLLAERLQGSKLGDWLGISWAGHAFSLANIMHRFAPDWMHGSAWGRN